MYCPRCAAENGDDTRYCRACGIDLESVAAIVRHESARLAATDAGRSERSEVPRSLAVRAKGARGVTSGVILLLVPLVTGPLFAAFANDPFVGLMLWLAFFGWMLIPGGFSLAQGLGALLESRVLSEVAGPYAELPKAEAPRLARSASGLIRSEAPPSVTEHTTRNLDTKDL